MESFFVSGPDNGLYAYEKEQAHRCSMCGCIDRESSSRLPIENIKLDVSCTYDNELVISEKIYKELIKVLDTSNFEKAGSYYYVLPKETVAFDSEKRKCKFGAKCTQCGRHSFVIGISPVFLKNKITKPGIYATDLCFGDTADFASNLAPGIILSADILELLLPLKPKGLDCEPTYS